MTVDIDNPAAGTLRAELTARLIGKGMTAPQVQAAFRAVPRHAFAPESVSLADAYADTIVVTKRDPSGKIISSVSAPWVHAYAIEQAGLRPGARVLEVGSGGYQAALLAEVVGPTGHVVTLDIDADITAHARAALDRAGYPHVEVVTGDGEYGYPPAAPYAAAIISVEAADVPPAWIEQLAPGGVLVAPLRMRAITRYLTLYRRGDHLAASAALQCGFVAMQGDGRDLARRVPLRGDDVVLRLDDMITVNGKTLGAAFEQPRVDLWAPVTITMAEGSSFESLHLWLASQPRPFGTLTVDRERTAGLLDPQDCFTCPTLLTEDSLAYLTMRKLDQDSWQFGAHGFGPDAGSLAADLIELITVWDRGYRHAPPPEITVHPTGTRLPATDQLQLLVPRRHTTVAVTWPNPENPR
jgi:protein-L-isoaspartate(D-aspartate) O-methyltransferase